MAIGFAFKDIFPNFLAGILLLLTRPFVVGDQICFREYEGEVEEILTRATYLRTYDGRRAVIPNADLFTNSVIVNTAFPQRRMQFDFGLGSDADVDLARRVLLEVMKDAEGVSPDPKADVVVVGLAGEGVSLRRGGGASRGTRTCCWRGTACWPRRSGGCSAPGSRCVRRRPLR